ncbi:MAG TPA: head protein, partial [Maribacter sp.]|nr:head protein [Maribacter sp.]
MAQVSGTFSTYDAVGIREDLTDIIYNISPTDTPFMSGIAKAKATGVTHEWQLDTLASAASDNAVIEGDTFSFSQPAATTRKSNTSQISTKTVLVSGTLEAVNKAGRNSEIAYQISKRSSELKRDMESSLTANNAPVTGNDSTARELAGS